MLGPSGLKYLMEAGSGCVWWWLLVDWCEEWHVIYLLWHICSSTNLVLQILCGFFHFLAKVLQLRMRGIAPCAAQNVSVLTYRNVHQNFLISRNSDTL